MNLNKRRWGRHFPDEEIASALRNNRLLTMEIETSHVCNLNCIYCYNNSGRKLPDELTYGEIIDVINQGIDLGVRRIIEKGDRFIFRVSPATAGVQSAAGLIHHLDRGSQYYSHEYEYRKLLDQFERRPRVTH